MSYYGGFPKYVSVAEKREKAEKSIEKLKKKNPSISPVVITGRAIAVTWWGKAWNDNLESYADYSNRIARGRSYVRHGAVLDLRCNCPDSASMCKHIAAVLYGIGARLDVDPKLFFVLRNIEIEELISKAIIEKKNILLEKAKIKSSRVMDETDISDLFGIDMETDFKDEVKKVAVKKTSKKKKI